MGHKAMCSFENQQKFRRNRSPSSSVSENEPSKKLNVKLTASKTTDFQQTTMRYVPEDRTLNKYRCENLRFSKTKFVQLKSLHCDMLYELYTEILAFFL